jgi:trehalose utilization protein
MAKINVTVWNEFGEAHKANAAEMKIYPNGLHNAIADFLNKDAEISAKATVLDDKEQGLGEDVLKATDVLVYWAHCYHDKVDDKTVARVIDHIQRGMGVIFLHSAHKSKLFMQLLGTSGRLSWREAEEKVRVWKTAPAHPIAEGLPESFVVEREEMYGEPFGIPEPLETVFISWFQGGNVFRSGVTYQREYGKVFYFQNGHETYPVYHDANVQRVITNAVKWAKPLVRVPNNDCPQMELLEKI